MMNVAVNEGRPRECGAISIKTLFVLVLVGAVAFMIIKLAPVYVEQTKVIHDVTELARVAAVRAWKEERINQDIKRIRGEYELPENAISFVGSSDKGVQIAISYQRNVDLLLTTYTWKVDHTAVGKDL